VIHSRNNNHICRYLTAPVNHGSATHLLCDGEQVASPLCAQVLSSLKWDEMTLYTQNLVQPRAGAQLMAAFLPKIIPQEVERALKGLD